MLFPVTLISSYPCAVELTCKYDELKEIYNLAKSYYHSKGCGITILVQYPGTGTIIVSCMNDLQLYVHMACLWLHIMWYAGSPHHGSYEFCVAVMTETGTVKQEGCYFHVIASCIQ
jgi:hypothetical protein